jgi:hypothetical protein
MIWSGVAIIRKPDLRNPTYPSGPSTWTKPERTKRVDTSERTMEIRVASRNVTSREGKVIVRSVGERL